MIIFRSKIKEIIFEFYPKKKDKGVIIICDGLPGVPKQKKLIEFFVDQGYSVFYPRYRGTWESGGEFLKESPARDIEDIISVIKTEKIQELYSEKKYKVNSKNINLIGSSFGGTVALSLMGNKDINKIIALSPIVDFKKHYNNNNEQDLNQLGLFIKKAFGEAYRFDEKNWGKMAKGEIFNPKQKLSKAESKKVFILFDETDQSVDYKKIKNYSLKNNIKNTAVYGIGHLSFSKLSNKEMGFITNWLLS